MWIPPKFCLLKALLTLRLVATGPVRFARRDHRECAALRAALHPERMWSPKVPFFVEDLC
jgi:hypothetical protein